MAYSDADRYEYAETYIELYILYQGIEVRTKYICSASEQLLTHRNAQIGMRVTN